VRRLEPLQLGHQRVEFSVGDLGGAQDVIAFFVVPDLAAEFFDPFGGGHRRMQNAGGKMQPAVTFCISNFEF